VSAGHVPEDIPLTSFSILMARYKGLSRRGGARRRFAIERLKDGDTVLICRGLHPSPPVRRHRHREDPPLAESYTGRDV
jgi:hypothetical protein